MTDRIVVINKTERVAVTAAGARGPQGPQGTQGPAGPQGPKGDPGEVTQAELDAHAADTTLHGGGGVDRPMTAGHFYFPSTTNSVLQDTVMSGTNGYSYSIPIWLPSITIASIGIYVASAANATTYDGRLGIYRSNTGGLPDALLIDAGTVSMLTTGAKSAAVNAAVTAGLYWLTFVPQNITGYVGAPTVTGIQNANYEEIPIGSLASVRYSRGFLYAPNLTGALPATYPYVKDYFGQNAPLIGVGV